MKTTKSCLCGCCRSSPGLNFTRSPLVPSYLGFSLRSRSHSNTRHRNIQERTRSSTRLNVAHGRELHGYTLRLRKPLEISSRWYLRSNGVIAVTTARVTLLSCGFNLLLRRRHYAALFEGHPAASVTVTAAVNKSWYYLCGEVMNCPCVESSSRVLTSDFWEIC